ncbi:MAG: low temperature requirement protein A [Actinomycetales bacterium]|jgi:low temperature requirement protein LtrA
MTNERLARIPSFRTRMTGRSAAESHRVSSPLELLFDLTFVVAIAQVSAQLAQKAESGDVLSGLGPYLMVFFAIWWAWMNFTWFASAYDTDDVPYRLTTMLQMGGVLVLAAGVPSAFQHQDYLAMTAGYLIMRVGLVSQWVRAAIEHPEGRSTALRYAIGITVVQVGWVSRVLFAADWGFWTFVVLAVLDMSVPLWAERTRMTSWHPHHIAERYGLFTIIVLGESVSAATVGVQGALANGGFGLELVTIAAAGLVLLFAFWWLYFLEPAAEGLVSRRGRAFYWGYGHYFVFASLAALGAGLEVAVRRGSANAHIPDIATEYAIAVPVTVFLLMLWVLHAPLVPEVVIRPLRTAIAMALVLLLPLASPLIGLAGVTVGISLVVAALVAATLIDRVARSRAPSA